MSEYTKGPWKVVRHNHIRNELWLSVICGAWDITHNSAADHGVIADAKYSAMSDAENLANAYLIAAAPELLEALEEAIKELHELCKDEVDYPSVGISGWDDINGRIIPAALAAIAKAKGLDQ